MKTKIHLPANACRLKIHQWAGPSLPVLLAASGLAAGTCCALAQTICYEDAFNDQQNINSGGPYTQTLAGSTPTTATGLAGGSASAVWLGGVEAGGWGQRDYNNNGVATPTSSNFLLFTPDAGYIYTLQATIDTTALGGADPGGTQSWFALGFTSYQHNWDGNDGATIDTANLVRFNSNQSVNLSYTLSGADLVAASIQYVGWITDSAGTVNLSSLQQVAIDNFSLTAVPVPEPGTLALVGLGALVMFVGVKRNRSQKNAALPKE